VSAFTVGITSARFEACKRGVAANYAAVLACDEAQTVCLVDADPRSCDVGTRLASGGVTLNRWAAACRDERASGLPRRDLQRLAYPPLFVLPVEPMSVNGDSTEAHDIALPVLRDAFDVVVVDLPVGAGRPGPTLDARLVDHFDALIVTVTPDRAALAATLRYLELFAAAVERGAVADHVDIAVVITGDEGSVRLDPDDVADCLGGVTGRLHQLWGRALPNRGFGPTLGIVSLETEIHRIHSHLRDRHGAAVTPSPAALIARK
jgi:Mrp family chromosome partitioning ATPase